MHPHAEPLLERVTDAELKEKLRLFFDVFDSMDRENTHLRVMLQGANKGACPYGHFTGAGCALGYPGCACMDDLMAMQAWSPQDEEKAAVRIGQRLSSTRFHLDHVCAAATLAAEVLDDAGQGAAAVQLRRIVEAAKPMVEP